MLIYNLKQDQYKGCICYHEKIRFQCRDRKGRLGIWKVVFKKTNKIKK